MLTLVDGRPVAVIGPTMVDDRIVTIDILADPERLSRLDLCGLDSERSDVEK
jgi:RNA polymerase sigma-70 factor (ECF subfamily)